MALLLIIIHQVYHGPLVHHIALSLLFAGDDSCFNKGWHLYLGQALANGSLR